MTLDRRSARTLSLVLNCESLSASLTMTGRPVSMTLRTMLSLICPLVSAMASRRTLRDARMRADAGRLTFSSYDDLIGHDIAMPGPLPGVYMSAELRKFLQEHHGNIIDTADPAMVFSMLASGRVDYAIVNLAVGRREIAVMGLSGKIEPILPRVADVYRCSACGLRYGNV